MGLSKGRDLTIDQKIAIAEKVCQQYATGQYTLESCLRKNGIKSESTWRKWRNEIAEIAELYIVAIKEKDTNFKESLTDLARRSLLKLVEGYEVTTVETHRLETQDGEKSILVKKVTKQHHIRPNAQAIIFALVNTDPDNFKQRVEITPGQKPGENIPLADWTDEEIELEAQRLQKQLEWEAKQLR